MERGYGALGWSLDLYRSHGPAPAGMGAGGHIRAVPGTSKLVNVGYRGLYMAFLADFGGFVRGTTGPFRLKIDGYAQDTWGGWIPPPGGCPWQLTCPPNPHPDHPPGLHRRFLVDFDV